MNLPQILFSRVKNRGSPPESFLKELIAWGRGAPQWIFEPNSRRDIYTLIKPDLALAGWQSLLHRRASMLEVLRVLAGFESSWNWYEGRDTTNSSSNRPQTEEAGIFQCSANSMGFDFSLEELWTRETGLQWRSSTANCNHWRVVTKNNHIYAIEHTARLLRFTVNHHGPVKRREINPWLRIEAVKAFEELLK